MGQTPLFYPNAITLTPDRISVQTARIVALAQIVAADQLSVKDSFATLDLTPFGYDIRFESTWIARTTPFHCHRDPGLRWSVVRSAAQLGKWESGWRGGGDVAAQRIFPPALLEHPDIQFVAAHRNGAIVAGGVLSRSVTWDSFVVGLSNVFAAPGEDAQTCWAALADQAPLFAPGWPIVGYEAGEALAWAQAAGFKALGPLRIWGRATQS